MEIETSYVDIDLSKVSQTDEDGCLKPMAIGILGCITAFLAYPILHGILFRVLVALHVFRVVDEFEQIYSNESGQRVLIWSLHLALIAAFALLYYARSQKNRKGDLWRSFALAALGWQIIAGSIFALLMTMFMNFST